eukprot:PITA_32897
MLLALLDQHCATNNRDRLVSAYVYLPIDFKNRCNLGYAFVNFTSAKATLKLCQDFHKQRWEVFNSRKICKVTYARVQGRRSLKDHFRNSRFACDINKFLPLAFDPPRNGNNLTDKIEMRGLEHSRNDTGGKVCNNSVQHEDGTGAADSKLNNLHDIPGQRPPRCQYNGQSRNKRMATLGTHSNCNWNNPCRFNTAHYRPLNAGASTNSNPSKD